MKKRKKKAKGMTLVEILIALAVFCMLALVIVRAGFVIHTLVGDTNHINHRVSSQVPIAEQHYVPGASDPDPERTCAVINTHLRVVVTSTTNSSLTYAFDAVEYSARNAADESNTDWNTQTIGDADLHYVVIP